MPSGVDSPVDGVDRIVDVGAERVLMRSDEGGGGCLAADKIIK